jgi:hypothetical protein
MANSTRAGLSSVFDEMVTNNKRRLDDLYADERPRFGAPAAGRSSAGGVRDACARHATFHPLLDPETSRAVRRLNERFGKDWRYEVADRQRDGDEAIVLCRLTFGKEGSVRAQFGRAQLSQGSVAGTSDGVQFRSGGVGAKSDENDAFRRATEAALMNCIDLI